METVLGQDILDAGRVLMGTVGTESSLVSNLWQSSSLSFLRLVLWAQAALCGIVAIVVVAADF